MALDLDFCRNKVYLSRTCGRKKRFEIPKTIPKKLMNFLFLTTD
jgi:hypothetical protein